MLKSSCIFFLVLILLSFSACRKSQEEEEQIINLAVAANMQFAIKDIMESFSSETQTEFNLVLGSSGKLCAQINQGAPYDIFISADTKYPQEVQREGKTEGKPKIYAEGKLVLWTLSDTLSPTLEILNSEYVQHIALANPKTAPYGYAAMEILKQLPFYSDIEEKLVFGESIGQTNQFITSKSAEIGITSIAVVKSANMKNMGAWIPLEQQNYPTLLQSAVILKSEKGISEETRDFYAYLFSEKAQRILREYGYSIPN